MQWFIPSFYGDIRLTRKGDKETLVTVERATPSEQKALIELWKRAVKKKWLREVPPAEGDTILKGPLDDVATLLAKLLKPNRKLVSVVKFSNGEVEELCSSSSGTNGHPYREPGETKGAPPEVVEKPKVPEKAATVAAPVRGCPAPDFVRAELKARQVLEHFLDPDQMEDFRRYNRFITVGGTTGHRYMVTSRHNKAALEKYTRTLFDLDEGVPYCVHDWSVPAAEEMLAIHLLLKLPGYEGELRFLH